MKKIVPLICCLFFAGCATAPVPIEQAKKADSSKLFAYQEQSDINDSTIIVVRDDGMFGAGCALAVYVNGKKSAFLEAGEKAFFHVPSGDHYVGVGSSENGLCTGLSIRTLPVTTSRESPKSFRISMDGSGLYFTPYFINEGEL